MKNFYKIENGYPQTYSGAKALDGFKEFTIDEDGVYTPSELNDAMVAQNNLQVQADFRAERNRLLDEVVDHYQKPLVWEGLTTEKQEEVRVYRQALLDSTIDWVLPAKPE